ncbi:MAG: hypothetical protein V3V01_16520 [Acidimicrobiales bacterium]
MPQPLMEKPSAGPDKVQERRLARSTARAFAAAISALLISALVVNRSSTALQAEGTVAGTTFSSGTIELVDDDQGRSLFDLSDMAPGRPAQRCLEIEYQGSILPVDLTLIGEFNGPLARFLDATIEQGSGGNFDSCNNFQASEEIFHGTLEELATLGRIDLGPIINTGDQREFRITFDLADEQAALGLEASASLIWEASPS